MRGSVLGSAVVHVGLVAGLITVRHRPSIVVPGPDVVELALLEPAAPPVTPPPDVKPPEKPRERAAVKPPALPPTEEQGVKLAPHKLGHAIGLGQQRLQAPCQHLVHVG